MEGFHRSQSSWSPCAQEENLLLIQRQVNIPALSFYFSTTIPTDEKQHHFLAEQFFL